MKVIKINSFDEIKEYDVEWNDLLKHDKESHFFLSKEWLDTWWRYFGNNKECLIILCIDKNNVLAAAPLMKSSYRFLGKILYKVEFIGTPHSDYHGFIFINEKVQDISSYNFLEYITKNIKNWDFIDLTDIPEYSVTLRSLKNCSKRYNKTLYSITKYNSCSTIVLPKTIDEYLNQLSGSMRRSLRRTENKLKEDYNFDYIDYNSFKSIKKAMFAFINLHQIRWQLKNNKGFFLDKRLIDFHLELAQSLAKENHLNLTFISIDNVPVSAIYGFVFKKKVYCYLSGFDPDYAQYGLTHINLKYLINKSIDDGYTEVDLMRGSESYKLNYKPKVKNNIKFRMINQKPIPHLINWISKRNKIKPLIKTHARKISNLIY